MKTIWEKSDLVSTTKGGSSLFGSIVCSGAATTADCSYMVSTMFKISWLSARPKDLGSSFDSLRKNDEGENIWLVTSMSDGRANVLVGDDKMLLWLNMANSPNRPGYRIVTQREFIKCLRECPDYIMRTRFGS